MSLLPHIATYATHSLAIAITLLVLWKTTSWFLVKQNSPLRHVPGPPVSSWLYGHAKEIYGSEIAVVQEKWSETYGNTFKYKSVLNQDVLYTADTRAVSHVFNHTDEYQKPEDVRSSLAELLAEGLLVVEGEQHRRQKRVMNAAFSPAQIRELTEIFIEKSIRLCNVWKDRMPANGELTHVNICEDLSRVTFDIIGLADDLNLPGFNHDFDSMNPEAKPDPLTNAFKAVFRQSSSMPTIVRMLKKYVPFFRQFAAKFIQFERDQASARSVMNRMGMQMIKEKKAEISSAIAAAGSDQKLNSVNSRNLLTVLIKANMDPSISPSQRLSDKDVLAQVPTFLVAGHETTSNSTAWAMFALSQAPEVQHRLREELRNVPTETPTMDELSALPYLDAVVREVLRLYAPVPIALRTAVRDDVLPLQTPWTDIYGQQHDSINVPGGTLIDIPLLAMNRSKELWGEDAFEFKPERWSSIPANARSIPGVWSNLTTFLGGPRSCIGYRFTIIEMKAIIFSLIRAFEFELAIPASSIKATWGLVQRPRIRGEEEKGAQLPMHLKLYKPL
ncbi:uncharacterized protein FIBRA_07589 [Fibroporia radiculosa]|uniref:Cytochrome P450 n=1 Tax=Fibroporia radiculosa TaxID=599839 RepID=J4GF04_9APHY|nr:uncharacterized protein FIBRA_07589 [Fibroporia radiculosa]CCM05373.1 predicted protein [Fibroporia radiculosa]